MNTWRWALWAFVSATMLTLLIVSFCATEQIAAQFQGGAALAFLLAVGVELGVVGCAVARGLRARAGQDARGFVATLIGTLVISFVASALAGAYSFTPTRAGAFFDTIGLAGVAWVRECTRLLMVLLFSAIVPVLTYAAAELLAMLISEETTQGQSNAQSTRNQCAINAQSPLRARIVELYGEHPELPAAEAARLLDCHPATVRRVRAQVSAKGG
jgi:hypothetical protein